MNLNIKHYDIKATIEDGDVWLQQDIGGGEHQSVYLSPEQLLMIADKLRGITRPDPEAEESRKLRVISDRMSDIVTDEDFRKALLDGQRYTDWLEKIDALDDLSWEYAYGLKPDAREPKREAAAKQSNCTPKQAAKHTNSGNEESNQNGLDFEGGK